MNMIPRWVADFQQRAQRGTSSIPNTTAAALCVLLLISAASVETQNASIATDPQTGLDGIVELDGTPLPGAVVEVENVKTHKKLIGITNGSGGFVITGLDTGSYIVKASRPPFIGVTLAVPGSGQPEIVVIDDSLPRRAGLRLELQRGGVISGRVVDEFGWPAVRVPVRATKTTWIAGEMRFQQITEERTNDLGEYRLYGLPSGDYYVSAVPNVPVQSPLLSAQHSAVFYPSATSIQAARRISVEDAGIISGVDIFGAASASTSINVHVRSATGEAMSDAHVDVIDRLNGRGEWIVTSGLTDSAGGARLDGLPTGIYLVRATKTTVTGTEVAEETVDVSVGTASDLVLRAPILGWIDGRISLPPDVRVPREAEIAAYSVDSFGIAPSARIADDGTFQVRAFPGRAWVRLLMPVQGLYVRAVTQSSADVTNSGVAVAEGRRVGDVVVQLSTRPGEISGTVSDGRPGEPHVCCAVIMFSVDPNLWRVLTEYRALTRIREDGTYTFTNVRQGDYFVALVNTPPTGEETTAPELERARKSAALVHVEDSARVRTDLVMRDTRYWPSPTLCLRFKEGGMHAR